VLISVNTGGNNPGDIKRVNIRDNLISAPRYHGVTFTINNSAFSISDSAVSGNLIWANRDAGYRTDDATDPGSAVACVAPKGQVFDIRVSDNEIHGSRGSGIKVVAGTAPLTKWEILGNRVHKSGAASPKPAIELEGLTSVTVAGNRCDTQEHGLKITNPTGAVTILGDTCTDNSSGEPIHYAPGSPGPSELRIRDNAGFSPWTGRATIGGGWGAGGPFAKESGPISFGVPFPAGKPPALLLTAQEVDAAAVGVDVSETGFRARLVAPADPGSGEHTVAWAAEPVDG
jgi:hypothetical protein